MFPWLFYGEVLPCLWVKPWNVRPLSTSWYQSEPLSRSTCYYDGGLTKTFRDTNMLKNKLTFLSLFVGQPLVHFLPVHGHLDQAGSANKRKRLESATGTSTTSPPTSWSSVSVVRPVQAGSESKRRRLESASATGASKVVPFVHWPWPILPPLQLNNSTDWFYTSLKNCHLNKWPKQPFHKQQTTIDKNRLTLLDQCKVAVKGLSANDSLSASGRQWTFRDSPRAGSPN